MFSLYDLDPRAWKRWRTIAHQCQQRLTEQQMAPGCPGTILQEVNTLLEFVGPGGIATKSLTTAQHDAIAASAGYAALTPTKTISSLSSSTTITGNGGLNVISIESISFSGATDKLTLDGGASDVFIVNVSGSVKLSHKLSRIQVGGGVSESRVLFNLTAAHDPLTISGGATIAGTYLAPNGGVRLSPAVVVGGIIGGAGETSLTSAARVECVPFAGGAACAPVGEACTVDADCCDQPCTLGFCQGR